MSLKSATCFMLLVHLSLNQHHFKLSGATSGRGYCPAQGSPRGNRRAVRFGVQSMLRIVLTDLWDLETFATEENRAPVF